MKAAAASPAAAGPGATADATGEPGLDMARRVADAVLYEGYVLYPYRASARKNQIRWQFGVVAPRDWSEAGGTEGWSLQAECLVETRAGAAVEVTLRGLRLRHRQVERALPDGEGGTVFEPVESVEVGDTIVTSWDEGEPHEVTVGGIEVADLLEAERVIAVPLHAGEQKEVLTDGAGRVVGRVTRGAQPVATALRLRAEPIDGPWSLVRLRARVENTTPWPGAAGAPRDEALRRSLAGTHLLLRVAGGAFMSLLDPPEFARGAVATCENEGVWPVLVGDPGRRDVVLASPVTLYDYPEIAPESAGDFCDATEIDEILALRVMTLTEEEKREARGTDPRAAAIVELADSMPPEMWDRLHGAIRYLRDAPGGGPAGRPADPVEAVLRGAAPGIEPPGVRRFGLPPDTDPSELPPWWDPGADASVDPATDTIWIGEVEVGRGTTVRLRPRGQADAQDLFLVDREATVEAVFADVDGGTHLAVTLADDPAADLARWHGRYLYFRPEELEVVSGG